MVWSGGEDDGGGFLFDMDYGDRNRMEMGWLLDVLGGLNGWDR